MAKNVYIGRLLAVLAVFFVILAATAVILGIPVSAEGAKAEATEAP